MKLRIIIVICLLLITFSKVTATIVPASYYSNVNADNKVYRTTLFVYSPEDYCANDNSVWSVNVSASITATCYTVLNSNAFWRVVLDYNNPFEDESVTLYYNHGGVSDSFSFNPMQFYSYDYVKQVQFSNGMSVFIGEPSLVRSINTIIEGVKLNSILFQTVNFDNSSQYSLELVKGNTTVGSFTGMFYKIKNLNLMLFLSKGDTNDDVYIFRLFENSTLIGDFVAYVGNYNINLYGMELYIFNKLIVKDNTLYIRVMNSQASPVNITGVNLKIIKNDLSSLLSVSSSVNLVLEPEDSIEIPVATLDNTQLQQLSDSLNIATLEVDYKVNGVNKIKKITVHISRKDISYVTTISGYVRYGQVNLIYPRPLATVVTDNFNDGEMTLDNVPLIFLFVESYNGHQLYVDDVSVNLHPVHGGSAVVNDITRVETVYTSSGEPVGVYRVKVNYSNIKTGLIPVVGDITIYAHYYIYFGWFVIPVSVTIKSPVEFILNTNNVQDALNYANTISAPIYNKLDTLKYKFKTYDYFWAGYSKDVDAGYTGHFFDYYDTAGNVFPVTDLAQNPKVMVSYNQDSVSILFDSKVKKYFNYDDSFTLVMNEKGVLKEPVTYTMNDVNVGSSIATEVTINLYSVPFVMSNYDYYFMQAYQTNGFLILKHQVYKTIVPFSMFKVFSVYFDGGKLTILNKGYSSLTYYPDASDNSVYYIIPAYSYESGLPIGPQPAIMYGSTYYYINPNYDFKPKLLNENIFLPIRAEVNPDLLTSYIVSDITTKKLYDLMILQLFPTVYKKFLLEADSFYTYSLTDANITQLSYNSNSVTPIILKQYYLYSYIIKEYKVPTPLYDNSVNLTVNGISSMTTTITYSDGSSRSIHFLLFDVLKRDFLTNAEKVPTLFNTPIEAIISYYDPRLAPHNEYAFSLIVNGVMVNPHMIVRSQNSVVIYYNSELSTQAEIAINNQNLILILPS